MFPFSPTLCMWTFSIISKDKICGSLWYCWCPVSILNSFSPKYFLGILYFVHFVVPMGIFPWEIQLAFPPKSQLQQSRYPTLINYNEHAGSFHVSVIHRTLTWTTQDLLRAHVIILVRAYTHGALGTPTASQHNIFDSEKLTNFSCAPDGIRTSVLWISSPTLYQLSHPVTLYTSIHCLPTAHTLPKTRILLLPF